MELHPLCTLFPRIDIDAFDILVEDIKANGLREPITTHNGMILDGGNRYAACMAAGIEPHFVEFSGTSIASFVLSKNLHRRHLTAGQKAAIVASVQSWAQAETHGGNRASGNHCHLKTVRDRAEEAGVSARTQRYADTVAKRDPELAAKVVNGEVTLSEAVTQVAPKLVARPKKTKEELPPEVADYDPRDDELKEARDLIVELSDQLDVMRSAMAVGEIVDDAERMTADEIIKGLRTEVATLTAERDALIVSRNTYQHQCAEMKKQIMAQRREIKRLQQ